MGHKNLIFFLITIVLLICLIRVIKSQNIELYCGKYASDVKCQASNYISVNTTVVIEKVSSKTLKQKELEDAPILIFNRDYQIEALPQKIGHHFKQLKELIVNLIGLKIVRRSDFNDMSSLSTLNLAENKLTEILSDTFEDLKNLTILFINGNQIKKIDPVLLIKLKMLRALNAQNNKLEILDDIFTGNHELEFINLKNNSLSKININFKSLDKLKQVDLRNNRNICNRCSVRNQKALNKMNDICIADDNNEKNKYEKQFRNCVMETLKTNTTFEDKLSDCTKDSSFVKCIMGRINEIPDAEKFLNQCLTSKKNAESSMKNNLEACFYCRDNINDIRNHAKLCELRYSEFSIYNLTTFETEVKNFFN
ncbi:unnamed protein product [Chironomus riparius]|uniref:Uncharacterized protein n=1 Tax=Chironomus riparius TaxID=315576 RepID=A0A9N9S2C1_9DIPT|nr:unnamed protein product [Chironomus riparius]